MLTALVNARVLGDAGFIDAAAVLLDGARIIDVAVASDARVRAARIVDLEGLTLAPGFIDCQVNGGGGVLFNDTPTVEGIARIAAAHRRCGTTGLLPTLISDDASTMRAAMAAVRAAIAGNVHGVLGIHLEGPFLAAQRKGIHAADKFRVPTEADIELIGAGDAGKVVMTIAPEQVATDTMHALTARSVILSAGHTAATYAQTRAALDAGVRGFTHLFNAMSPLQSREPGVVGAALEDRSSWCGVIVDGHHVHPATLQVALAAKPRGKVFLVTDAMPPVGADNNTFTLNGETITCRDGKCTNAAGVLAGSALDMASAVRNTVNLLGVAVDEALRMASTYPAAFLGLEMTHGRIAPGYAADLVALDAGMQVRRTWIHGVRAD
ncbi:MAG: N-acetylglucosamine-6-phosphate deacetylase [Proteobacteria bacterium]|nr:N-acetylglucosamine-6-phosphate deacetylase [Pseudomonadota bacterium]